MNTLSYELEIQFLHVHSTVPKGWGVNYKESRISDSKEVQREKVLNLYNFVSERRRNINEGHFWSVFVLNSSYNRLKGNTMRIRVKKGVHI